MPIDGFHHVALQVQDLETVCVFYRDVLGLAEQARHHRPDGALRSIWLSVAEGNPDAGFLALEQATGAPEQDPFLTHRLGWLMVSLRISPVERGLLVERLSKHHIELEHQTRWTLYVRDPEGNRVGLSHHPHDPLPM